MRSHRAFVTTLEPVITVTGREFEHLRVLRAGIGDQVTVFDGAGLEADSQIIGSDDISITLELGEIRAVTLEPPQAITLAIALLKADKLSDVVRACTELGVTRFQLLSSEFSDKNSNDCAAWRSRPPSSAVAASCLSCSNRSN
jgi:16S rRNA (uracil1498-N3)-methyltransferase